MRLLPETIKAVLQKEVCETHDIVELTIAEQITPPLPQTVLYMATADGIVYASNTYTPSLRSVGPIKLSLGKAPDNADVIIENVSRSLGFTLTDQNRALEGSKAVIKKAFKLDDGSYEFYTLMNGVVQDLKIDQQIIQLSIVSDMSRSGTYVGGRQITQRCLWIFKDKFCGWTVNQMGDPVICDYGLDTVNGCESHGNTHRFGGVPAFSTVQSGYGGYDPTIIVTHGGGDGWCVTPETKILCCDILGNNFWLKAYQIKIGDNLVSIDKFGTKHVTKVLDVVNGQTSRVYTFQTEKGYSLSCSPSHPIMQGLGYEDPKAAYTYKTGDNVLTCGLNDKSAQEDKIISVTSEDHESDVIIFKLKTPHHTFVSGATNTGGLVSHNTKPIFTGIHGHTYDPLSVP